MTVRDVVLPIGAVLVLGLGVYLFVEVRAQSAPPEIDRTPRPPRPAIAAVEQAATRRDAAVVAPPPDRHEAPPVVAPPVPVVTGTPEVIIGPPPQRAAPSGPKLDAIMDEANKAYDRGDFEDAKIIAARVLANDATNVRMLRIMVSAACQDGDGTVAQVHFSRLPPGDQEQMKVRCARYGITFPGNP